MENLAKELRGVLVGEELRFYELDNLLVGKGFRSNSNGKIEEILESETVVYTLNKEKEHLLDNDKGIVIDFNILTKDRTLESIIKITGLYVL